MTRTVICLLFSIFVFLHPLTLQCEAKTEPPKEQTKEYGDEDLEEKNPWLAFGMSLIVPGAGQIYVEEDWWPGAIILAGIVVGIVSFIFVDQARANSLAETGQKNPDGTPKKNLDGTVMMVTDARLEILTLMLQIAVPSFWIWNFGDAFNRAEEYNKKVTGNIVK